MGRVSRDFSYNVHLIEPEEPIMLRHLLISILIILIFTASALIVSQHAHAQPGTQADPAVSLSYLRTAMSMQPMSIEGGEDIQVAAGERSRFSTARFALLRRRDRNAGFST